MVIMHYDLVFCHVFMVIMHYDLVFCHVFYDHYAL